MLLVGAKVVRETVTGSQRMLGLQSLVDYSEFVSTISDFCRIDVMPWRVYAVTRFRIRHTRRRTTSRVYVAFSQAIPVYAIPILMWYGSCTDIVNFVKSDKLYLEVYFEHALKLLSDLELMGRDAQKPFAEPELYITALCDENYCPTKIITGSTLERGRMNAPLKILPMPVTLVV